MKKISFWMKVAGFAAVLYLLVFHRIPYYIERPGGALELNSVVEVDGEFSNEPGSYMMTTVAIGQATPLTYFMRFFPHHDGITERDLLGDIEDHGDYVTMQRYYMNSSIHAALVVAFDTAEIDYEFDYHGIYVMQVFEYSGFFDDLEMGDTIVEIDGQRFESSDEFIDYVSEQEIGQTVELVYERQGEEYTSSGQLIELESTGNAGIGISLVDNTTILTDPEVEIHSGEIGGPSAGLMFALQVYSLLEDNQLRSGYDIAGTGTISDDGSVGRIGGVDKKVVAADREGASIFFVPDDPVTPEILERNPDYLSNYQQAVETAESIGTDMEIVPITQFEDAINYLEQLEPLESSMYNNENLYELALAG